MCFGPVGSCPESRWGKRDGGEDRGAPQDGQIGPRPTTEDFDMVLGVLLSTPTGWALMRGDLPASVGFIPLPLTQLATRPQAVAFCLALGVKVAS